MKYPIQLNKTELPVFKRLLTKTRRIALSNQKQYVGGHIPRDELGTAPEMILMNKILHYINSIEEEN